MFTLGITKGKERLMKLLALPVFNPIISVWIHFQSVLPNQLIFVLTVSVPGRTVRDSSFGLSGIQSD